MYLPRRRQANKKKPQLSDFMLVGIDLLNEL